MSWSCTTFFQCLQKPVSLSLECAAGEGWYFVYSDTGTEDRCCFCEVTRLGNSGDVKGFADCVLLEGSIDGIATQQGFWTTRFECIHTILTGSTSSIEPLFSEKWKRKSYFDADVVPDFYVFDVFTYRHCNACSFMTTHEIGLCIQWPITLYQMRRKEMYPSKRGDQYDRPPYI